MNALSSQVQAERLKIKEKKAKKVNKTAKLTEAKAEPATPTKVGPTDVPLEQKEEEPMEGEGEGKRINRERDRNENV